MITQNSIAEALNAGQYGTTSDLMVLFDQLEIVSVEEMIGQWIGKGIATNHAMDGMLETYGWYGKIFENTEKVHPLLFLDNKGKLFKVNPALLPFSLALKWKLPQSALMRQLFLLFRPLLRTNRSKARLRLTTFRGKTSATMIYDHLPINDIFRKVNDHTLLGCMDMKGMEQPFFFLLERDLF
ncbi:MAG TPA: DUF4334 domain-containing protein [Saprospiraceae bacterium]|nr:DUF4334 domain-containing protein [Saprospiraceae bacterium]HMQ81854.1 DUF4334 domain-containing protein [Saprospiraceae bacterium]